MSSDERKISLYEKVRQFFQPYYRKKPRGYNKTMREREKNAEDPIEVEKKQDGAVSVNGDTATMIRVYNCTKPLTDAIKSRNKPGPDKVYCYRGPQRVQVFACFAPGSGRRWTNRDDAARKQLRPVLYPNLGEAFDRTHLIPIGFHGSENDPRLVVGWDKDQNRNLLKKFEQRAIDLNQKIPIYWMTEIEKTPKGAIWRYRIFDARNPNGPENLMLTLDSPLECDFVWKA